MGVNFRWGSTEKYQRKVTTDICAWAQKLIYIFFVSYFKNLVSFSSTGLDQ